MSRRSQSSSRLLSPGSSGTEPDIQPDAPDGSATPAATPAAARGKRRRRRPSTGEPQRQRRQRSDRVMPPPPSDDPPESAGESAGDPVDPLDAPALAPTLRSLREWRIKQGMTQQQVAFASGLGITTVRDIERERRVPSIVTARKLVRALGITLEQVRWPDER